MIQDYIGFVYCIKNIKNKKLYLGKKGFYQVKYKQVKKKKKRLKVSSDWQNYFGSNDELKNDVLLFGEESFKREILYLCKSKGWMTYYETREILVKNALIDDQYYNTWCTCKIHRNHLKV